MTKKIMLSLAALAMVAGCERPAEAVAHTGAEILRFGKTTNKPET